MAEVSLLDRITPPFPDDPELPMLIFIFSSLHFCVHTLKLHFSDAFSLHSRWLYRSDACILCHESQLAQQLCEFWRQLHLAPMPPKSSKRKSGAGAGEKAGKAKAIKVSAEQLEAFPHVPKVVRWLLIAIVLPIVWCKFDQRFYLNLKLELRGNFELWIWNVNANSFNAIFAQSGCRMLFSQRVGQTSTWPRRIQTRHCCWESSKWKLPSDMFSLRRIQVTW